MTSRLHSVSISCIQVRYDDPVTWEAVSNCFPVHLLIAVWLCKLFQLCHFIWMWVLNVSWTEYYFVNKGPSSQGYGFSSGHVCMWKLHCEESWAPKNWRFWTVVLEKTLESPLDCKEIQPVHPKGDQSWAFIGRTDVEAETPILWPPDV